MPSRLHLPLLAGADGAASLRRAAAGSHATATEARPVEDSLGRPLGDLRISVTDRCNFRCGYCMPRSAFGPNFRFLPQSAILTFEEITHVARAFVELGVRKLRLTGGEPLLRSGLTELVAMLAELDVDLALTTNGALLATHAKALQTAGLRRITVSLDALDDATFRRMNDVDFPVSRVLEGIAAAREAGLPVKVNTVVRAGLNDDQVVSVAKHFKGTGIPVRFIEYMDVGSTNDWRPAAVTSGRRIVEQIHEQAPLEPLPRANPGEVASRFRYEDGGGEVGVITSVTEPFCRFCTRARLSAEGRLFLCLFAREGVDLREPLRRTTGPDPLRELIRGVWQSRTDRYSELRGTGGEPTAAGKIEMSYIGG